MAACLLLAAGCGRASGEPARFSGHLGARGVDVASVRSVPARPPGYEILGHVVARCRADEGVVALDDAWLGDVGCSDDLLRAALREKVARVGGELLVGLSCKTDEQRHGDLLGSTLHTCSAKVAASAGPRSAGIEDRLPLSRELPRELPYASADDAWRVSVTVLPADASVAPRRARDVDRVAELAAMLPGRIRMSDVIARCPDGCERDAARYAVRAAAGRVGATDIVGIACVRSEAGWLCTGQAARPEADPDPSTAAR